MLYIEENTNYSTLWTANSGGGWVCQAGTLQHPLSPVCCCHHQRSDFLADILFTLGPKLSSKFRRTHHQEKAELNLSYALSVLSRVYDDIAYTYLFDIMGEKPTRENLTLTMQPSCISLTDALNAIDTAQSVCSADCVNSMGKDETEVSPAVSTEELVLDQANVGVNDSSSADNAAEDHSSEQMELEEVATDADKTIVKVSPESVTRVSSADADTTKSLETQMDEMKAQLADIASKLKSTVPVSVQKKQAKKRSSRGAPTVPRILKRSHNGTVSKAVSHVTVPEGPLEQYKQTYQLASPAIAREILCISECTRFHRSQGKIARLEIIPPEFYDAGLETLESRGAHLVFVTEHGQGSTSRSSSVTSAPPAKVVKLSDGSNQNSGKTSSNRSNPTRRFDARSRIPKKSHTGTKGSNIAETQTTAALAQERTATAKGQKDHVTYSNRPHASSRKSNLALEQGVPSSSSAAGHPGATRQRKDTKRKEKISPLTYMNMMERGEAIPCFQCNGYAVKSTSYACKQCGLDCKRHANNRMIQQCNSTTREQVPGIDYESFPKEK